MDNTPYHNSVAILESNNLFRIPPALVFFVLIFELLCRSGAMLLASVCHAPTAWPSRSNVASRRQNGRRFRLALFHQRTPIGMRENQQAPEICIWSIGEDSRVVMGIWACIIRFLVTLTKQ